MRKKDDMTMNLFDYVDEKHLNVAPKIEVVHLDYVSSELISWQELFDGFDTLYAITFSSGIGFVNELLGKFSYAEIIFGCEDIMSLGFKEIMAFQNKMLEYIREDQHGIKDKMMERIKAETAHFFVSKKKVSHEKIYILKAKDGRKRVITGSANMSSNAFTGKQREIISYIDGEAAFDYFFTRFEELKKDCVDEISEKALTNADLGENIGDLPFAETVKKNGIVTIEENLANTDEIKFILDINEKAKKIAPLSPTPTKKSHILHINCDDIVKLRRKLIDEKKTEQDMRSEYPQLKIDVTENIVTLNDKVLDLSPSKEDVYNDVNLFLRYMNGYSKFHGDVAGLQYRYFEFANWFFCSPFMAVMRDMAARYDQNKLPYPVFGLLYGQSKAGKTTFLETLLKMMIGQKPKVSAPDFTRSSIETLKNTVMGAPIIVDDLTNTRFNQHAVETIKNDDFGLASHLTNYSAVVISANEDVKAVAPEIIRRTIICRVEAGLTNTEVMKDNVVRTVQQKIGTAFYREYLRRMLDVVNDMIERLKDEDSENAPDILHESSKILLDILKENVDELPEYARELSLENYFSEQVTGKHAIKTIRTAWKTTPKSFKVIKRTNELRYNAGAPYEADRIMKELPENLEAHKSREWIVMNLEVAREFFDMPFKKKWFARD